jgi:predicted GNAT family N-acyltransferase
MSSVTITQVTWLQAEAPLSFIRRTVFMEEQNVPEELEWDGLDEDAIHILAMDEDNTPIGTARMLRDGHIGRMAVLKAWRQQGIGSAMLHKLIQIAQQQGLPQVELDAQTHAIPFYESYDFVVCSGVFIDAGIPHKKMKRVLK